MIVFILNSYGECPYGRRPVGVQLTLAEWGYFLCLCFGNVM